MSRTNKLICIQVPHPRKPESFDIKAIYGSNLAHSFSQ